MIVCYVTDRLLLGAIASLHDLLPPVRRAAAGGIDWIQIREKDVTARELFDFTRHAVIAAQDFHSANEKNKTPLILVNDRIDVALAAGAGGVHLAGTSTPPSETVQWLRNGNAPPTFTVGVSCHSLGEAVAAEKAGANYVFFGPVYDTPKKTSFGAPQGVDKLTEVCRNVRIPVFAIGGITEVNAVECVHAGVSGIAAIRMFQESLDATALASTVSRLHKLR